VGAVADFFLASPSTAFSEDAFVSPAFNARRISCCVSSGLQATARAAFLSPPTGRQEMPIRTASQGPAGTQTPKVAEVLGAKSRSPSPQPHHPIGCACHFPACFNSIRYMGLIWPLGIGGLKESGR